MPMKIVKIRRGEIVVAFVLVTASFTVGLWLVSGASDRASRAAVGVCRVSDRNTATLRQLLTLAQHNAQVSLRADPERLRASREFYRQALNLLKPVDCAELTGG